MSSRSIGATTRDTIRVLRVLVLDVAFTCLRCGAPQLAVAQDVPAFAPGMISHMQQMSRFKAAILLQRRNAGASLSAAWS